MNVLLVNPLENILIRQYDLYPSGALILMGTMLHNRGYNVKIIHMASDKIEKESEIKKAIIAFKPDIVGITMNTFQTRSARYTSQVVKNVSKSILTVVGGPHPSALKERVLDDFPCIDVIVIGEGEQAFLEIVEGKNLKEIKGIYYRLGSGYKINELRPLAEDLDYIPLPNLDLVDINRFSGTPPVGADPSMFIMASRGCPYQCIFCNKSIWGNTVRFRKPEAIIEEIRWLHGKYGVKEISFTDDTFNLNRKWAEATLNLIIDRGLNKEVIYKVPFRANEKLVDEALLQLAKEAGFWLIFYGVESGNQQMLDRMKKGLTIREIKSAFELTHKVGMKTIASFIIGLPGENVETVEDTFDFWKILRPYGYGFSPAIPFPGTEFEKNVIEKGHLLSNNYDEYSPLKFVVRTESLTKEELEHKHTEILNRVNRIEFAGSLNRAIRDWSYFKQKLIMDSFKDFRNQIRRIKKTLKILWQKLGLG